MNAEFGVQRILQGILLDLRLWWMWEDHLEGEEWRENVGLQTFYPVARDTHLCQNVNVNVGKTYIGIDVCQ